MINQAPLDLEPPTPMRPTPHRPSPMPRITMESAVAKMVPFSVFD